MLEAAFPSRRRSNIHVYLAGLFALTLPVHLKLPFLSSLTLSVGDLIALVFALWSFSGLLASIARPLFLGFGAFFAFCILSYIVQLSTGTTDDGAFASQLIKNVMSAGYMVIFLALFRRDAFLSIRFCDVTVWWLAALSLVAVANVFIFQVENRATWPFLNPNAFAAYLLFAMSCALPHLLRRFSNIGALLCISALAAGMVATGSRGGILAIGVGLTVWLFASVFSAKGFRQLPRLLFAGLFIGLIGFAAYSLVLFGQGEGVAAASRAFDIDPSSDRDMARIQLWQAAIEAFNSSPFVGVGLGQYGLWFVSDEGVGMATHNTYLSYLAETGVIGFAFVMYFILWLFLRAFASDEAHPLRDAMLIYIPAAMTQGFFNNVDNFRIIWIAFAITLLLPQRQTRSVSARVF